MKSASQEPRPSSTLSVCAFQTYRGVDSLLISLAFGTELILGVSLLEEAVGILCDLGLGLQIHKAYSRFSNFHPVVLQRAFRVF